MNAKRASKPKRPSSVSERANPIASTLQGVHGYPDRLKIYRIPASQFWWVRATFGERRIKRSTKETNKAKATRYAKQFYEELLKNNLAVPLKTSKSFARAAQSLQEEHRQKAMTGERNERFESDLRKQLTYRILPFFKPYALKDVNYEVLAKFVTKIRSDGASSNTINRYLVSVRQILKHAVKLDLLDSLPIFPSVTAKDNPRPWFSEAEYEQLKTSSRKTVRGDFVWKGERISIEAHHFITFMVNTFLRPSDWYELQRKHVHVQKRGEGEEPLLIISPPTSKTINTPIVSMPAAVGIYESLKDFQDEKRAEAIQQHKPKKGEEPLKPWDDNAYLFLPHVASRRFAQAIMRAFFEEIVKQAGLQKSHGGANRTIYSLRHTAIAFRLLKGENVDLLFLARNCRTSVDMIDRFYCRHLNALMAPEKIVGLKAKKKSTKNKDVDE